MYVGQAKPTERQENPKRRHKNLRLTRYTSRGLIKVKSKRTIVVHVPADSGSVSPYELCLVAFEGLTLLVSSYSESPSPLFLFPGVGVP